MTFGTVRSSSFQFLALPGFLWDFLLRQGEWELALAVSLNAGIEKMWGWDFFLMLGLKRCGVGILSISNFPRSPFARFPNPSIRKKSQLTDFGGLNLYSAQRL